jgi:aspartate-semialdehyde dehydrogenase
MASASASSSASAASLASRRSVKNASLMKKMSPRNMERNSKATDRRRGVVQTCAKKTEDGPRVCIAGVTGAVGQEFLRVLKQRDFPYSEMKMLASARSAGKKVEFDGETYTTEELTESSFDNMDIALFSAGGSISKKFGPIAVEKGCFVVDNSSAFRMTEGVPLVIPEVNPEAMSGMKVGSGKGGIIANPNCSTIIALMATTAIQRKVGIERMVVSTYQAASGAGAQAMAELEQQTKELVSEGEIKTKEIFPWGYAFNLFSHNAPMMDNGYNEEEMKMVNETKKIWNTDDITIAATCIRVPVMRAHAESINLTLKNELSEEEARQLISDFPGASLIDDRANNRFPMPSDASDQDDCFVGRIRRDISQKGNKGLELFVCGDQIRKGAAQNAVQVAELLL